MQLPFRGAETAVIPFIKGKEKEMCADPQSGKENSRLREGKGEGKK